MYEVVQPTVAIVILNWNNPEDTLSCLRSVALLDYTALFTIVVDNGSTDDSVVRIRAAHPAVKIIETKENLGYAGGNNVGIRHAMKQSANYICILNNDVIVSPIFLRSLIELLEVAPDIGVVTPLIAEFNKQDQVWALGASVDQNSGVVERIHAGESIRNFEIAASFDVDVAPGSAMMVKRGVFEQVGLLDEDFFLYYEEIDWCLHVRQAGYRILATTNSLVWHKVSASMSITSPVIDYYMQRNYLRLINRHWSGLRRWYLLLRTILQDLVTIAAYSLKTHDGTRIPHRNARLYAIRDAISGRWGPMGSDAENAI